MKNISKSTQAYLECAEHSAQASMRINGEAGHLRPFARCAPNTSWKKNPFLTKREIHEMRIDQARREALARALQYESEKPKTSTFPGFGTGATNQNPSVPRRQKSPWKWNGRQRYWDHRLQQYRWKNDWIWVGEGRRPS